MRLLESGSPVDQPGFGGKTALMVACIHRHAECANLLITYGANVLLCTADRSRTCLHYAAKGGDPACLKAVLRAAREMPMDSPWGYTSYVNWRDRGGVTALHYAARSGRVENLRMLLREGAHSSLNDSQYRHCPVGNYPLHWAAAAGDVGVVKELLVWGADRSLRDSNNLSACDVALRCGNMECAAVLNPRAEEPLCWPSPWEALLPPAGSSTRQLLEQALAKAPPPAVPKMGPPPAATQRHLSQRSQRRSGVHVARGSLTGRRSRRSGQSQAGTPAARTGAPGQAQPGGRQRRQDAAPSRGCLPVVVSLPTGLRTTQQGTASPSPAGAGTLGAQSLGSAGAHASRAPVGEDLAQEHEARNVHEPVQEVGGGNEAAGMVSAESEGAGDESGQVGSPSPVLQEIPASPVAQAGSNPAGQTTNAASQGSAQGVAAGGQELSVSQGQRGSGGLMQAVQQVLCLGSPRLPEVPAATPQPHQVAPEGEPHGGGRWSTEDDPSCPPDSSTCHICCIRYKELVRILPCQHELCGACLLSLCCHCKPNRLHPNPSTPACPFCRTRITSVTSRAEHSPPQ